MWNALYVELPHKDENRTSLSGKMMFETSVMYKVGINDSMDNIKYFNSLINKEYEKRFKLYWAITVFR